MFADRITKTVTLDGDVPGEDPINVVLQKLSARTLATARERASQHQVADLKSYGAEMMRVIRETQHMDLEALQKLQEQQAKDPVRQYDRDTVLQGGVKSWDAMMPNPKSTEEKPLPQIPRPLPGGLDALDEASAVKLFKDILELSGVLQDAKAAAEAEGKS